MVKKCPSCKRTQESGKFCSDDGTKLEDLPDVNQEMDSKKEESMETNDEITKSQESLSFESPANKKIKLSTSIAQISSLNPTIEDKDDTNQEDPYAVYENDSASSVDEHELSAQIEKIDVTNDISSNESEAIATNKVQQQQVKKPSSPQKRQADSNLNIEQSPSDKMLLNDKIKALLKLSQQVKKIKKESFTSTQTPQNNPIMRSLRINYRNQLQNNQNNLPQVLESNDKLTVIFHALIPKQCFASKDSHIRMSFYFEQTNQQIQFNIQQKVEELKSKMVSVTHETQIPRELVARKHVVYMYYIENPKKNDKNELVIDKVMERLFEESNEIHLLDIELSEQREKQRKNDNHDRHGLQSDEKQTLKQVEIVEQYDGIVLFGNEKYDSKVLNDMKRVYIENTLPSFDKSSKEKQETLSKNEFSKLINKFQRIYESLCHDNSYKQHFEDVLNSLINTRVDYYHKKRDRTNYDYACIISLFYLANLFQLRLIHNGNSVERILKLHDVTSKNYYCEITTAFESVKKTIFEVLRVFLVELNKKSSVRTPLGFNVLLFLFSLSTSTNSSSKKLQVEHVDNFDETNQSNTKQQNKLNSFMDIIYSEKFSDKSFSDKFKELFDAYPQFGVLFLNYFGYGQPNQLKNLLELGIVGFDSLLSYIKIIIQREKFNNDDQNALKTIINYIISTSVAIFEENSKRKNAHNLATYFFNHHKSNNQLSISFERLQKAFKNFNSATEYIPSKWEIICGLIQIFWIFFDVFTEIDQRYRSELWYELLDVNHDIQSRIEIWYRRICNESVEVTYGLVPLQERQNQQDQDIEHFMDTDNEYEHEIISVRRMHFRKEVTINEELKLIDTLKTSYFPRVAENHEKYHTGLNSLLKSRLQKQDYVSILNVRANLDALIKKNNINFTALINIFDDVIHRVLMEKATTVESIQILVRMIPNDKIVQKHIEDYLNSTYELLKRKSSLVLESRVQLTNSVLLERYVDLFIAIESQAFKVMCELNQERTLFNDAVLRKVNQWKNNFINVLNEIKKGTEVPYIIRLIEKYAENGQLLLKILPHQNSILQIYPVLIKCRSMEITSFETYFSNITQFITICNGYENTCDLTVYKNICGQIASLKDEKLYPLNKFVNILNENELKTNSQLILNDKFIPRIEYFTDIDEILCRKIQEINKIDSNYRKLFDDLFLAKCKDLAKNGQIKIDVILNKVYPHTIDKLKEIALKIDSGKMKLIELQKYFSFYDKEKDRMINEFQYICSYFGLKNYRQREKQINLYFKFENSVEGAREIEKIRKQLNLTDKFSELSKLLSTDKQEKETWDLNTMDSNIEKTVNVLSIMNSDDKLNCLKAFVQSMPLVQWLRTNTQNIMGLKFLVDLASASTNEPNADKDLLARALKDSGTAFAPLIFELKQDAKFHEFMSHCEKVWHFLQDDKHISQKLIKVGDKIDKLDEIKQKGNVEVSTLKQAKICNENGVYIIKNHQNFDLQTLNSIDSLISLEVIEPKAGKKSYNYTKLKEIQNILMLVAKKNNSKESSIGDDDEAQTLDYFIEIFEGIIRLSEVFLKLAKSGCLLFEQFDAKIYCDVNNKRKSQPILEFFIDYNTKFNDQGISTQQAVSDFCKFMEGCLKLWQDHVVDLRNRYNSLNYFTINQLIYVRKVFEKMLNGQTQDNLSIQKTRFILNNLFSKFDEREVKLAFEQARVVLREYQSDAELKNLDQQKAEFIRKIASENSYDTSLVKKAVDLYGIASEEKILSYCLEKCGLEELTELQTTSVSDDTFKLKTQKLWNDFLIKQSDPNFSQLSIHRLAIMLEIIKKINPVQMTEPRRIPGYLSNRGCPNLIVCPQLDQIAVTLSIYLQSPNCPLPSNDEVLFCTRETTQEEIENFFRVAVYSNGNKIYTVLNVQELNYDTSHYVEKKFNTLESNPNYVLVIICSADKATQSIIASSFSKFRVQPILNHHFDIQNYLKAKFRERDINRSDLAANCDPESYCVRGLLSEKSGCGKTLYVKNFIAANSDEHSRRKFGYNLITIKTTRLNTDHEIDCLFEFFETNEYKNHATYLYHLDIAHEVLEDVDSFLFNLLILGYLKHSNGLVWRRSKNDLYLIEIMPPLIRIDSPLVSTQLALRNASYHMTLNYIPKIQFRDPKKYLYDLENEGSQERKLDASFNRLFMLEKYQCVCQYLRIIRENPTELNNFKFYNQQSNVNRRTLNELDCLIVLLNNSMLKNPSWSELHNFVTFLNEQFQNCDNCFLIDLIPGFNTILIKCIELMSYDFALPGLNICEETPGNFIRSSHGNTNNDGDTETAEIDFDLNKMSITRRWERLNHPYILFNADKTTLTFMGLYLCRKSGKFLDTNTEQPISDFNIEISSELRRNLLTQRVPIYKNFNSQSVTDKITALRNVMGLNTDDYKNFNPDPSYELTIDNSLKIMAIYLRFRSDIPVVIMGESGCGKTRLIKFLCDLHIKKNQREIKTLVHVKVHGGTTADVIEKRLREAEKLSSENFNKLYNQNLVNQLGYVPVSVILFFDEANTTEAIGLIKEIMCDRTCNGKPINFNHGLKIIAACNPYKKHSQGMIDKLEQAGLGFCKSISETKEKLGHIPMRQLVYRVHPLPGSMLPLVWDFGQLNNIVEKVYIEKMLQKAKDDSRLPNDLAKEDILMLANLLAESQNFMREKNDECSFVSLRDIERVIKVASWFYQKQGLIFSRMNIRKIDGWRNDTYQTKLTPIKRAFILSLAICYHASLQTIESRSEYRRLIRRNVALQGEQDDNDWFQIEILKCQHIFLDEIELNKNIAKNSALLENVFMMTICVELRIPLFIVGKPGSSKSLAKSIVANAMQGKNSKSEFYKELKEAYFVNFQCSPLTTPEMIVKAFNDAAKFQKDKNLDSSVAVVNLDEIGLAEASDSMPLKTLHPLLEEGTDSDECGLPYQKVGVIGISNWALDPAKMNRGIFVSRGEPNIQELIESAKGICKYDSSIFNSIEGYIKDIAKAYLDLCQIARQTKREFFGLRDFYSLIKMIYWFCSQDNKHSFTWNKLEHSVKRNFSGLEIDPIEPFLPIKSKIIYRTDENDPKSNPIDLVQAALRGDNVESNSRYLLLLTENYAVLDIVQNYLINIVKTPEHNLVTIFGSSFQRDQQYTEVCRNISRIKHSMEIGNTVILLNFDNLYESLYDALNQYYHYFAGQKFVDLGLGTHRVKCSVHDNFRLIVIAEKKSVYDTKRFPIPLLNRLEKHYLSATTMLNEDQEGLVADINKWVSSFCMATSASGRTQKPNQVFIGYHDDTIATLVLYCTQTELHKDQVIEEAQTMLLQCVTADSIVRLKPIRGINRDFIWNEYFVNQKHSSLDDMVTYHLTTTGKNIHNNINANLLQITTHSRLLVTKHDMKNLAEKLRITQKEDNLVSCILNSFDTQQQFVNTLREFLSKKASNYMQVDSAKVQLRRLLLIQTDLNDNSIFDLIACARHVIVEEFKTALKENSMDGVLIAFIINIPRENAINFSGFQVSYWTCYHVDDLEEAPKELPSFEVLKERSLSSLLEESLDENSDKSKLIDMKLLMKKCAHLACSFIKDDNLKRTIDRIEIFLKLCSMDENTFLRPLAERLISIQKQKENGYQRSGANWLVNEAANLKNVNQYSTLRKSCQNYLESKISPLLGYLLSIIDNYFNLDVFNDSLENHTSKWKKDLWLRLFKNEDVVKLNYEEMISKGESVEELKEFLCNSQWTLSNIKDATGQLKPCLPFFWLLSRTISEFYNNFRESNIGISDDIIFVTLFRQSIPHLFGQTTLFSEITSCITDTTIKSKLFEDYINDFVLLNCKLSSKNDLEIIKNSILQKFNGPNDVKSDDLQVSLPMIHLVYEQMREQIDLYLKFVQFEPEITQKLIIKKQASSSKSIEIEACLLCIQSYKNNIDLKTIQLDQRKLFAILQLTSNLIAKLSQKTSENQIKEIKEGYEILKLMHLFIENISQIDSLNEEDKSELFSRLFRRYLIKDVNFKDDSTLESFQQFLNYCAKHAQIVFFLSDTKPKCCNAIRSSEYFKLVSCGCLICEQCKNAADKKFLKKCPLCNSSIPTIPQLISLRLEESRKQKFDEFTDILNSFYLDVLECLIFDNETLAKPATVQLLLGTITSGCLSNQTENKYSLEIRPQYRSLLLQIVLKKCKTRANDFLARWFEENTQKRIELESSLFKSSDNLATFFIDCICDQMIQQTSDISDKIKKSIYYGKELSVAIETAFRPTTKAHNLTTLTNLAHLKFVLGVLAYVASDYFNLKARYRNNAEIDEFLSIMKNILDSIAKHTTTVSLYLIKELIRKFGSATIKTISSIDEIKWITPVSLIGDNEQSTDRYVILGDGYTRAKNAVKETLKKMKSDHLINYIQETGNDAFPFLSLALYKEVTFLHKRMAPISDLKRPIDLIDGVIRENFRDQNQVKLLRAYLQNDLPHKIKVTEKYGSSLDLSRLLIHFKIALTHSKSKIIKPLNELLLNPISMKDTYFPTMPQDSIFDIQQALLEGRGHDNPKFYACPNGHPYVLFDCGRPWVLLTCRECGAQIGGTQHRLLENNRELNITDSTLKGYCLQEASTMSENPSTERNLTNSELHTLRFFLHCALYLACSIDIDGVKKCMLKDSSSPFDFFWAHLNNDLRMICKTLNMNLDEIYIILHNILNSIMNSKQATPIDRWTQKNDRQTWENTFSDAFLRGTFKDNSKIINKCTKLFKDDCSNENDKAELYFMAYELIPNASHSQNVSCIYEKELFWKYRPALSFNIMSIELKNTTYPKEYNFLKTFIRMKDQLEIIFDLPAIIRMINILYELLNKKIFKEYSQKKSLMDFLSSNDIQNDNLKKQIEYGLEAFQRAWQKSKSTLPSHINQNLKQIQIQRINFELNFTLNSKLSYFLLNLTGDGSACYSLIHYLVSIHNELISFYKSYAKQSDVKEIEVSELENCDNTILFDSNGDLFRIVLANYQYDSKESKLYFRYKNIERQIIERYLQTKQLVSLKSIRLFEYSEEMSDMAILKRLKTNIKQTMLEDYVQKSIYDDFKNINETSEALHSLKTIINFAVSTSASEEMKLSEFVRAIYANSYKYTDRVLKINTIETCQLKHLNHLWLILMMKRAVLFSLKDQDTFEFLDDQFRKPFTEPNIILNPQNSISYALIVYQLIVFFVSDLMRQDEYQLACGYDIKDTISNMDDELIQAEEIVNNLDLFFPSGVKLENIYELWKSIVDKLSKF